MTTGREFFNTKARLIEYQTISLYHPAFGHLRYVGKQFFEKTLGGEVYAPAAMAVTETVQDSRNTISYEVQMGRVGSQVKELTKAIDKYPIGWMIPILATADYWLSDNLDEPYRPSVTLSIGNLSIEGDSVAFTLDTANPRGQSVAVKYSGETFPGTDVQQ